MISDGVDGSSTERREEPIHDYFESVLIGPLGVRDSNERANAKKLKMLFVFILVKTI